jgi:hypothetical protein
LSCNVAVSLLAGMRGASDIIGYSGAGESFHVP